MRNWSLFEDSSQRWVKIFYFIYFFWLDFSTCVEERRFFKKVAKLLTPIWSESPKNRKIETSLTRLKNLAENGSSPENAGGFGASPAADYHLVSTSDYCQCQDGWQLWGQTRQSPTKTKSRSYYLCDSQIDIDKKDAMNTRFQYIILILLM